MLNLTKSFKIQNKFVRNYNKIGVLGVPFNKGAPTNVGVIKSPDLLRNSNLIPTLQSINENYDIKDYGNVTYDNNNGNSSIDVTNIKCYNDVINCNKSVMEHVKKIHDEGRRCLTIGGDHSIAVGTIYGHIKSKENVSVLYIDAHADINTNKTSGSGNAHGMSLAFLIKELNNYWHGKLPNLNWLEQKLSIKNLAYIALRSVDPYERYFIEKFEIPAYGMREVTRRGVTEVIDEALKKIDPEQKNSIHVSFDIDSLDYNEAPSTILPIRGGLMLREALQILEIVEETGRLNALDLVEINPDIGNENDVKKTVEAAFHVISTAFGEKRQGKKI